MSYAEKLLSLCVYNKLKYSCINCPRCSPLCVIVSSISAIQLHFKMDLFKTFAPFGGRKLEEKLQDISIGYFTFYSHISVPYFLLKIQKNVQWIKYEIRKSLCMISSTARTRVLAIPHSMTRLQDSLQDFKSRTDDRASLICPFVVGGRETSSYCTQRFSHDLEVSPEWVALRHAFDRMSLEAIATH